MLRFEYEIKKKKIYLMHQQERAYVSITKHRGMDRTLEFSMYSVYSRFHK